MSEVELEISHETGEKRYDGSARTEWLDLRIKEDGSALLGVYGPIDGEGAMGLTAAELIQLRDFLNANIEPAPAEVCRVYPVTGQPIETAHEALINLIRQADGVWLATPGEIQLQKGGRPFANIKVPFAEDWNRFASELMGRVGYDPDRIGRSQRAAAAKVREILDRPDAEHREVRSCDDFDPWDILPTLFGSYDSRFDDCVIDVLCELRDKTRRREDLAADMVREMLCTADLCDYGTSPRHCFATAEFRELLPELIERWQAYAKQQWEGE